MGKVTAYAHFFHQGVDRTRVAGRGIGEKGDTIQYPVADRLHAAVTLPQMTKLLDRKPLQPVRLAISAGIDVGQDRARQIGHSHLAKLRRLRRVVVQIHGGGVAHRQRAGKGLEAR